MNILKANNNNIFRCLAFIIVVFPFISHIYSAIFPMLYGYQIARISALIILFTLLLAIFERKIVWHKEAIYFVPFLLVAFINSLISNDLEFSKYFGYIVVYFYFLKRFFVHNHIFRLYVNILVITFLIMLVIYFFAINFDLYNSYRIDKLNYLSLESPMQNYQIRGQIFYLLIFSHEDFSGIFNLPRFYGFSREPGMYVMFLIPGLLLAFFYKMKFQSFILGCAILITSSFAGFFVMGILFFMNIFNKRYFNASIYFLVIFALLIIIFRGDFYRFDSLRINDYVPLVDQTINMFIGNLTSFTFVGILFVLSKLSYLLILYSFYKKIIVINSKLVLMFFVAFVLSINKATELLSPLFLFYLLFIELNYNNHLLNQNKKNITEGPHE